MADRQSTPAGENDARAVAAPESKLKDFGEIAIERGYCSPAQIEQAQRELAAAGGGESLATLLVKKGILNEQQMRAVERAARGTTIIAGFEILEKVGQGGMGAVFRARQLSMDRIVALKILPPKLAQDPVFIQRFLNEARVSARLSHLNIINGIDCGEAGGYTFFAMEFVDGRTVKQILKERGKLPAAEAAAIVRQIADALVYAGHMNMVHRDIKPDNIMLTSGGTAKLCDLGLAKQTEKNDDPSLTRAGIAIGTPHYISPEQARGLKDVDCRSDIYSLGATFYHMLTGHTPFSANTSVAVMALHIASDAKSPCDEAPDIPAGYGQIIAQMMAKSPADRYAKAEELVADLDAVKQGREPKAAAFHAKSSCTPPRVAAVRGRTTGPLTPVSAAAPIPAGGRPAIVRKPAALVLWGALAGLAVACLVLYGLLNDPPQQAAAQISQPETDEYEDAPQPESTGTAPVSGPRKKNKLKRNTPGKLGKPHTTGHDGELKPAESPVVENPAEKAPQTGTGGATKPPEPATAASSESPKPPPPGPARPATGGGDAAPPVVAIPPEPPARADVPVAPPPEPAQAVPPGKPEPTPDMVYAAFLKELVERTARMDLAKAQIELAELAKKPQFAAARAQIKVELADLAAAQSFEREAFKVLAAQGIEVKITEDMARRFHSPRGKVVGYDAERGVSVNVNGAELQMPACVVPPEDVLKNFTEGTFLARVQYLAARGEAEAAQRLFEKLKDADRARMEHKLRLLATDGSELGAQSAFENLATVAATQDWKNFQPLMEAFDRSYGATGVAVKNAARIKAWKTEAKMPGAGGIWASVFHPLTCRDVGNGYLELTYDFSTPEQLRDFTCPHGKLSIEGGRMLVPAARDELGHARFIAPLDDLRSLSVSGRTQHNKLRRLRVLLMNPAAEEIDKEPVCIFRGWNQRAHIENQGEVIVSQSKFNWLEDIDIAVECSAGRELKWAVNNQPIGMGRLPEKGLQGRFVTLAGELGNHSWRRFKIVFRPEPRWVMQQLQRSLEQGKAETK